MGSSRKLKKIYEDIGNLKTNEATSNQKTDNILEIVKQLAEDFKDHSEAETLKFDKYDKHLQEVNKTLQDVVNGLGTVRDNINTQSQKQTKYEEDFKEYKRDKELATAKKDDEIKKEFKEVNKKLNKWSGGILALISVIGVVTIVYNIMSKKLKDESDKYESLKKEVYLNRSYSDKNYGKLQAIKQ